MSNFEGISQSEALIEFTSKDKEVFPREFCEEIDRELVNAIGADSAIVWALGGKLYLRQTTVTADAAMAARIKAELVRLGASETCVVDIGNNLFQISELQLGRVEIEPGYYPKKHLYVINGRIYVEDDYVWCALPDNSLINAPATEEAETVYADEDYDAYDEIDEADEEELESSGNNYGKAVRQSVYSASAAAPVWLNHFPGRKNPSNVKFDPLVVNSFDLDKPILKVEVAYRNAVCESASRPECGWMVLLHDGHFYIPVETIEDPINREIYYYTKLFNSFPVPARSPHAYTTLLADIFSQTFALGICYRAGYSANWRKYFFEYILTEDYVNQIIDFYKVTDEPYGTKKPKDHHLDYDGFDLIEDEDEDDEEG